MAIPLYLAMTAGEFKSCASYPRYMAWMACHFSPYATGLSNCPSKLPADALIILNDRTPISGHDPSAIAGQLKGLIEQHHPRGILLDFQRPDESEMKPLAQYLVRELPCPVCVSELYARELTCPVFLPPPKLNGLLSDHLAPWKGREIWLEAALDSVCFTVTEKGCRAERQPCMDGTESPFSDNSLHCHYRMENGEDAVRFYLHRTKDDLAALLEEAETLGVTQAIGLYQELGRT